MGQLKFWYEIHNYQSHRRVAAVYRQMLSLRYTLAESIDGADVVVLHLAALPGARPRSMDLLRILRGRH